MPSSLAACATRTSTCTSRTRASVWKSSTTETADPELWNDQEQARKVTTEQSRVRVDVELIDGLDERVADLETLFELAREESDDSVEGEIADGVAKVGEELDRLELRALFSGEHDERDAICEINAGAGGTDAQDWAEMLLRMYYALGAEPRLRVRSRRDPRGPRGGDQVRDVHRARAVRVRQARAASAACTG